MNADVVIIGAGPAGIFTALEMIKKGSRQKIIMVEKGQAVENRHCPKDKTKKCVNCKPYCHITTGFSGAGAFSDGKLSLSDEVGGHVSDYIGHKRAMDYIHQADDIYLGFGASKTVHGLNNSRVDEIAYEASRYNIRLVPCPVRHLGTGNAGPVLGAMHDYLVTKTNTTFLELTSAEDILCEGGKVTGVKIHQRGHEPEIVYAPYVVTAPGRGGAGGPRYCGRAAAARSASSTSRWRSCSSTSRITRTPTRRPTVPARCASPTPTAPNRRRSRSRSRTRASRSIRCRVPTPSRRQASRTCRSEAWASSWRRGASTRCATSAPTARTW